MDYKELLDRAAKLDEEATPGPWMWDLRTATKQCYLLTQHSGQYYVMGFERWGMQEALPSFQVYDKHEGEMHDRGSRGMYRADKISKSYPGKEHHKGYDDYIDNPDAKFIAESRQLLHELTAAVSELIERAVDAEEKLDEAERDILHAELGCDFCLLCAHCCVDGKPLHRTEERYMEYCDLCDENYSKFEWRGKTKSLTQPCGKGQNAN